MFDLKIQCIIDHFIRWNHPNLRKLIAIDGRDISLCWYYVCFRAHFVSQKQICAGGGDSMNYECGWHVYMVSKARKTRWTDRKNYKKVLLAVRGTHESVWIQHLHNSSEIVLTIFYGAKAINILIFLSGSESTKISGTLRLNHDERHCQSHWPLS